MNMPRILPFLGLLFANFFLTLSLQISAFAQGSLTPLGAPAPTMKSLDQIEPRVPIESLPAGGSARHQITQPGSYYLSSNLVAAAGQNGISVAINDVTIDLKGFAMFGVTNRSAILASSAADYGLRVFNGRLLHWSSGVRADSVSNVVIEDLNIQCAPGGSFRYGINLGLGSVVRRCQVAGADGNTSFGINVSSDSVVEASTVHTSERGINVDDGCRVEGCAVSDCGEQGIFAQDGGVFRNNIVKRCDQGIRVRSRSVVADNLVQSTAGSGFYAAGSYNRFERNASHFNVFGFQTVFSSTNFVVQNIAHGNTNQNYNFLGSVVAGPTVTTIGTVTNHPWANFSF